MAGSLSLDNALTGLLSSRRAIDVVSQNIANASREDYSRQRAVLQANRPLTIGTLSVGTGVGVTEIVRSRDELIDFRFRQENQNLGQFEQLSNVYQQLEGIVNEPSDQGLRGVFGDFDAALQTLVNDPGNRGARSDLVGKGTTLSNVVKRMNTQFQQIAGTGGGSGENSANAQIDTILDQINNVGSEIASLNTQINSSQAAGGNPNDLLDKRDALVNEISEFIDTTVNRTDNTFRVNVAGFTLVQGGESHRLLFENKDGSTKQILYDDTQKSEINPKSGRLRALIDLRDKIIPNLVDQLNDFVVQFTDRFNDLHQTGFGLGGQERNPFWSSLPTKETGIFRVEGMGDQAGTIETQRAGFINAPDTVLTGDGSTPRPENFEDDPSIAADPTGRLEINNSVISYDMSEDTIGDIIERINENDNRAEAYLSAENRLVLKGSQENDYELSNLRDTGMLLEKTNIASVGGSDRTGQIEVTDPTATLVDGGAGVNFEGDTRIDQVSGGEDLATGTLQFTSSNSSGFSVNYDARSDSLNDVVQAINTAANGANSNISADVTSDNRLRLYASQSPPNAALNPGTSVDSDADFSVNDTEQGGSNPNVKRNLLNVLGVDRIYNEDRPGTEFAIQGEMKRPPLAEQVAGFEVADKIKNNPDLIAAAAGQDTDLDGVAEQTNGPGDGSNAQQLSELKDEPIMENGNVSPDDHIGQMVAGLGNDASLANREKEAAEKLVNDIREQRQQVSGVSLDEEITQLIRHQQTYQASARIISTTQQMTASLFQVV